MPTVTVITPTADQPIGMRLLEKYMARQTAQPDQWIVADDGREPAKLTMDQQHLLEPRQHEGGRSLASNMLRALKAAAGEIIIICEHDDWYAPDHIEICIESLRDNLASGSRGLRYYNAERMGWRLMENGQGLSALCQTAFRREALPHMKRAAESCMESGAISVDFVFWQHVSGAVMRGRDTVVGMKGLPGRRGLGIGHRSNAWQPDPDLHKLREWIGRDADNYRALHDRRAA